MSIVESMLNASGSSVPHIGLGIPKTHAVCVL